MKIIYNCCLLLAMVALVSGHTYPENYFVIEGMQVEWEYEKDELTFKLHSPYQGWVALGFNNRNAIVNAHVVMGAVEEATVKMDEYYVLGFGNQQPLADLGGVASVTDFQGQENNTGTTITFTLDITPKDEFHYDLKKGNDIWLICAYSMEDDFGHHSIMRRHIKVQL